MARARLCVSDGQSLGTALEEVIYDEGEEGAEDNVEDRIRRDGLREGDWLCRLT